jgi:hypothetical protein
MQVVQVEGGFFEGSEGREESLTATPTLST